VLAVALAACGGNGNAEPGTTSNTNPTSASVGASGGESAAPSTSGSPNRSRQEVQEFGAKAFQALVSGEVPAGEHVFIRVGEKVLAICRIPSDSTTPPSIRKGGYYEIPSPESHGDIHKGQRLVIAANTFENQGPTSTYDPNVPVCDPAQDAAVGYNSTSSAAISQNIDPFAKPSEPGDVMNKNSDTVEPVNVYHQ
jgi:hypothetical protein